MATKIFIPQKCRVGFQNREDTFTKKLAYVIYYDSLGRLRKETSWKCWCHLYDRTNREGKVLQKAIDPYDFDNVPTSGFVLNKGVQRCNWGHFSSGRSMIRIYDPRGVEFEITPDNLIGILMHADCSHREIQCDLVYAWCGTELVLLPCVSDEYRAAANFTALQTTKVPVKDLKEGATYITKREEKLVYLGRHLWYEVKENWRRSSTEQPRREGSKEHIFCNLDGTNYKPVKSVSSKLAAVADPNCHAEFANWVSSYLTSEQAAKIIGWREEPIPDEVWNQDWNVKNQYHRLITRTAFTDGGDNYTRVTIACGAQFNSLSYRRMATIDSDLYYANSGTTFRDGSDKSSYYYGYDRNGEVTRVTNRNQFFDLYAQFSNGLEKKWS